MGVCKLACVCCGAEVGGAAVARAAGGRVTCPRCGPDDGILEAHFDFDEARRTLTRATLAARPRTHWRYRELLPLDEARCPASADLDHIGWTPILEAPRLSTALGIGRLRLKDEGRSASASFKDRASSVGVARAMQEGFRAIACASTGNAASSLACCAARAGLECNIFVSQIVPEAKLAQLLACGARVFKLRGDYEQAYDLCTAACERFGWYNRNAAINPYLVEGKKTGGMEIAEQCMDDPPEWVVCSIGDGCSIAGVYKGVASMRAVGLTDWSVRMLGVQAAGVAPLVEALASGSLDDWRKRLSAGSRPDTYADSINCPVPRNWRKAVRALRESDGALVTVSDDQIREAVRLTGRLAGVFAEPAAAAAVAGVAEARRQGILNQRANVLAMITGSGLKDVRGALSAVGGPHEIDPELGAVEEVLKQCASR
ncbi:MAG: pyridoxal-phosphate dependent enzyme [Phycisphaerae bacterium]|jgi:threonine synthase